MNSRLVLSRQRIDDFIFNVFGMFACMHDKIMRLINEEAVSVWERRGISVHYVISFQRLLITLYTVACWKYVGLGCMGGVSTNFLEEVRVSFRKKSLKIGRVLCAVMIMTP